MTQDSTMALGADFISDIFETPNTLAHKGVKGMKWGKHKAQTPTTAPASTIGELVNKYNETPEEMKARKAMVDEYLKTKGKDSGTKKAGGKGGGKGGGGKKGGAKKGSKKPAGSGGSGGSRASSNNAPAKTYEPRKNSYAPRKAIADILASVPKNLGPKAPKASVQAIIDKINASVDARKALQHELISNSEDLETIEGLLAHYGVLGMKWGVRKDDIPKGLGASGGGQIDEEDLLLAELMAKGLTADEIKKKIEDTLGKVNRTIEDIQYEIDKFEEHAVYPWEDVNQRVERQNNARNRRIEYDRRRDAEAKAEKDKQKAEDDAHGGRIYYDPMGFPTSPDDPFGRPAPRGAKHSSIEGGEMSNGHSEFTGLDTMDKILAHYGILGMKWGVRNDDRGSGRPQGGPSKKKAPLASVKKAITKSPASTEEIVNKFYAKHTPKSMEFTMKDSATGKESFPIKYDEKILKRMSDQQNHAVFQSQKGVPKEVAERELAYIKSQMKAASESLNAKTPETEKTSQGNRISDDELRAVINRLQMEKTYNQLMAERNPPAPKKAESAILKILRDSTRQAAGEILKGTVTAVGKYAIAAAISRKNPALATAILSKNEGNWAPKDESQNGSNSNKQSKTTTSTTDMTPSDIVQQIVDEMEKRRAASSTNP